MEHDTQIKDEGATDLLFSFLRCHVLLNISDDSAQYDDASEGIS